MVFKIGLSLRQRAHSSSKFATVTGMQGGSFSKLGFRRGAANIRLENLKQLQGWRAVPFQNWALAVAPRTSAFNILQQLHGSRADGFQNWALALAPRTFVHM